MDEKIHCPKCAITFSHRSSLVRHLRKKCNQLQPQTVRRKSCTKCVADKARCNLKRPTCARCASRQAPCVYPALSESPDMDLPQADPPAFLPVALAEPAVPDDSFFELLSDPAWDLALTAGVDPLFGELAAPISGQLYSKTEPSIDNARALANHSMQFVFRVLRSWPRMLAEEFQTPPLIHHTHLRDGESLPAPLANCFTLVKMWHGQCQGAEDMVRQLIMNEINGLLTKFEDHDESTLLATLQAVTIYILILLFPGSSGPTLPDSGTIFQKVQSLVNHAISTGIVLQEEREQMRPSWNAWVHITSKRRALLSLYLTAWACSVHQNVPPFNCRDLGFMPAPAAKVLWSAQSEAEWNLLYIKWLARWDGRGYLQGEFDQIKPGIRMQARAEKWLEETDEFGMVMVSIVNATEYNVPAFGLV